MFERVSLSVFFPVLHVLDGSRLWDAPECMVHGWPGPKCNPRHMLLQFRAGHLAEYTLGQPHSLLCGAIHANTRHCNTARIIPPTSP